MAGEANVLRSGAEATRLLRLVCGHRYAHGVWVRGGGMGKFWLRRLVLAGVLLAASELAWSAFGVGELVVLAAAGLAYLLVRLAVRLPARSARTSRELESRRPPDRRDRPRREAQQVAEAFEHDRERRRVAQGRGR